MSFRMLRVADCSLSFMDNIGRVSTAGYIPTIGELDMSFISLWD